MSLASQVTLLAQALGAQVKAIKANAGNLGALSTTEKSSLVGAINELKSAISSLSGSAGAAISDTAGAGDTTHTWSADKLVTALAQVKSDIVAGAPAAYDTLVEIANKLTSDDTALNGLLTAVGNRVSYADAQALTSAQQAQACANMGVGDPATDFVAAFNTALS